MIDPVQGEKQARTLLKEMLAQKPDENSIKSGVLKIRDGKGDEREVPVRIEVRASATNWLSIYEATPSNAADAMRLTVIHPDQRPNEYRVVQSAQTSATNSTQGNLPPSDLMAPFAGSDFWIVDLGLEFLHWPRHRLL